ICLYCGHHLPDREALNIPGEFGVCVVGVNASNNREATIRAETCATQCDLEGKHASTMVDIPQAYGPGGFDFIIDCECMLPAATDARKMETAKRRRCASQDMRFTGSLIQIPYLNHALVGALTTRDDDADVIRTHVQRV